MIEMALECLPIQKEKNVLWTRPILTNHHTAISLISFGFIPSPFDGGGLGWVA
jgi:hypothetical protein